ncbi:hypothetical protein IFM89_037700 [Coptis chinensis]|uniref:CBF1-interacting co-repressor CIR N-terminal domain-containing protein n=1 Tax=Coptis chinensis TaxID=261450 RepID=A0A835IJK0_9MAGN|nr:hypothetical protein IFM89_037700 [Coptis chinensis]
MGGHGGLNILPQKSWNVYNFDNREKVKKDEEAAAKEDQIKREQSRKRDTEFRIHKLKLAKGLQPDTTDSVSITTESNNNHINLFQGIKVFPFLLSENKEDDSEEGFKRKKLKKQEEGKKKEKVVVSAEDDKYRLGYGIVGKGVKAPWYVSLPVKEGMGVVVWM